MLLDEASAALFYRYMSRITQTPILTFPRNITRGKGTERKAVRWFHVEIHLKPAPD